MNPLAPVWELSDRQLLTALRGFERALQTLQQVELVSPEPRLAMQARLDQLRAEIARRGLVPGRNGR